MEKLIFVTGNENKLKEFKNKLVDYNIVNKKLEFLEIQGKSEEIIKAKVKEAYSKLEKPCFVEDVSFGFEAWNWLPGPYIKEFVKIIGTEKLPRLLEGHSKKAKAICWIGYAQSKDDIIVLKGEIYGKIVEARFDNGFDFDRIFVPEGYDKTFSEMTIENKNKISHRGKAIDEFKKFLENKA